MTRVKNGIIARKKRTNILKYTKGFRWGRKSKEKAAKEALKHAFTYMFRGRKERKRVFRSKWQTKINAASRMEGVKYSDLIKMLKEKDVKMNRKMLSLIAETDSVVFQKIVAAVK
ncbi:MAG: 50S ribosomal protein L20 [Candidatus Harrisonbacteria bacterium]|nr:50S ribosomal protein L20 [Candidatus Harrisonbacteria bacterium]